jgi:aryl-alcohol dehydrogenase-like predicted oxidoreductase
MPVSVIGLGTWQFGGEWGKDFTQDEVDRLVGRADELGVNLIDTAECYGDHLAETLVGHAIAGGRDRWIVATKFGRRFHANRAGGPGADPGSVRTDHWTHNRRSAGRARTYGSITSATLGRAQLPSR